MRRGVGCGGGGAGILLTWWAEVGDDGNGNGNEDS